jgi:trehalose synthase
MKKTLYQYRKIVGDEKIAEIYERARPLFGKHITHINSTYVGGGVAEMIDNLVPLMNDVGVKTNWDILHGSLDFFTVTKKFHNALQGGKINLSEMKTKIYFDCNEKNAVFTRVEDEDCVIVHDPQPLPLITFYDKTQPWIWRCHVDISEPNDELWNYLKTIILRYDAMVVSSPKFKHKLPLPQYVIPPAIDPLSAKNKSLTDTIAMTYLSKYDIEKELPIITQVSRFDRSKDPLGVIKVYELVKKKVDCQLVLAGAMATDDPEGAKIYKEIVHKAEDPNIKIISGGNDIFINALQTESAVVVQKSLREGFGLTVTEAMWKGTPVVGANVGGIPLQILDGKTGYLVHPTDYKSCADKIIYLLRHPDIREKMGISAREHVRKNFLITRTLLDWLEVLNKVIQGATS